MKVKVKGNRRKGNGIELEMTKSKVACDQSAELEMSKSKLACNYSAELEISKSKVACNQSAELQLRDAISSAEFAFTTGNPVFRSRNRIVEY